jgi:hypothetical protein
MSDPTIMICANMTVLVDAFNSENIASTESSMRDNLFSGTVATIYSNSRISSHVSTTAGVLLNELHLPKPQATGP